MRVLILGFVAFVFFIFSLNDANAQNATLIIHNNRDATLTVYAHQIYGAEETVEIQVPPRQKKRIEFFLAPRNCARRSLSHAYTS